ncbi:MAG: 3-hydroxyacyl-CoA dehydrogenase family protein [Gemmataceae bacterium]|nr:3-hydroxyacyl-CoA dehydrogenase family protein [Gemmataceae bacterium]MDW8264438.1 3-hydroxyacyl-CoA dehydrogenase family protein [Gemmataceae bacterium]
MPTQPADIVAVLGLGTMGHGIAQVFAVAGYRVHCWDEAAAARWSLHDRVSGNLQAFVSAGLLPAEAVAPALERLVVCAEESAAVAEARYVTEAVREDLATKQELFARLERLTRADAVLASNSSSFPISQIAAQMQRPDNALVAHWFNPPHLVPLVEVVPGPRTRESAVGATVSLLRSVGKLPIRLRQELPGFLVNRVQVAIQREVWDLLERGVASAEEIDTALRASIGFRLAAVGPLEVHDFGGLDIQAATYRNLVPHIRRDTDLPTVVGALVAQGHFGVKSGRGFYDYPEDRAEARRQRRDRLLLQLYRLLYAGEGWADAP